MVGYRWLWWRKVKSMIGYKELWRVMVGYGGKKSKVW